MAIFGRRQRSVSTRSSIVACAAVTLMTAAFVFLGAASAVASSPSGPWFHANLQTGHVGGGGWSPNELVTVQMDADGVPGPTEYEIQRLVMSDGTGWIDAELGTALTPGKYVHAYDGVSTKTLWVQAVSVDGFDLAADTVAGSASVATTVQVEAHDFGADEHSTRMVNSGGTGSWSADFSVAEGGQDAMDLHGGVNLTAIALDADGDGVQADLPIPNPNIEVDQYTDEVNGGSWPRGALVSVSIDDPGNGPGVDLAYTVNAGEDWGNIHRYTWEVSDPAFDITPGCVVSAECEGYSKTTTVTTIMASGADEESDVVTGTGTPGTQVSVEIYNVFGYMPQRTATIDGSGHWSVSFATTDPANPNHPNGAPYDVVKGTTGGVRQYDEDGDSTRHTWRVYDPRFTVQPGNDFVSGYDWPPNQGVTIDVDEYPADGAPEFTFTGVTQWDGNFRRSVADVQSTYDIKPFSRVTVSCGSLVKQTDVTNMTVTGMDADADTISGTAAVGSTVFVQIWMVSDRAPWRTATADIAGNWTVSFATTDTSNPNPDDPNRNPFDILPGTGGGASQSDGDGDGTEVAWQLPNPEITVAYDQGGQFWGSDFLNGSSVTIAIDDPANGPGTDCEMTTAHDEYGTFYCSTADQGGGFVVGQGMRVTATDGVSTKELTLANLAACGVDVASDIVTGTTDPGAEVQVWIQNFGGGMNPMRWVTADGDGVWTADFGVAVEDGGGGWGQTVDLVLGSSGAANRTDEDGDTTQDFFNVPNPWIAVDHVQDRIFGDDWASEPNGQVTITIDDPANGEGVDFTTTDQCDQWNGGFYFDMSEVQAPFDILPGMTVRVVNGSRDKSHVVCNVFMGGVDTDSDIVTGTAEPGAAVQAFVKTEDGREWPNRYVTADESGLWSADFSVADTSDGSDGNGWGRTFDIARGTRGSVSQYEVPNDSDQTQIDWNVPAPWFGVNPVDDSVWGGDMAAFGATATITIDDPENGPGVDFTMQAPLDYGSFWANTGDYSQPPFDIRAGMLIRVSCGSMVKEHTVTQLSIGRADKDSDILTGTAEPGSTVQVYVQTGENEQPMRFPVADGGGVWTANFGVADTNDGSDGNGWGRVCDLQGGMEGNAFQRDNDDDHTQVRWFVPDPRIKTQPEGDNLIGWNWPAGAHVLLTVDDLTNGVGADLTTSADCDNNGYYEIWSGGFDIQPGMVMTATDGVFTRVLSIASVAVTDIDIDNDVVSGVAEPNSQVMVSLWDDRGSHRNVTASSGGTWSADFAQSVADDGQGWGAAVDIGKGSNGGACQDDEDGDQTEAWWRVPYPCIQVDPVADIVTGWDFAPNSHVDITIENSTTPQSPDATCACDTDNGGGFWTDSQQAGFGDITDDCVVTVTDGASTKELDVTNLSVTNVDKDADTVSGTADPRLALKIWANDYQGEGPEVPVSPSGLWTKDWTTDVSPLDLHPGSEGGCEQRDEDGDSTQVSWRIANPSIEISAVDDWIEGHDWEPGSQVLITIDDLTVPGGPEFITTATPDPSRYIGLWDSGFDVKAGQVVTFTDGSTTKTHIVTSLVITGWDESADTVWGTAEPNSHLNVELWVDEGFVREVDADGEGNWIADFTDPVGMDPSQGGCDMVKGTDGRARQGDDDGDQTAVDFHVLNPRFTVAPAVPEMGGSDWSADASITVTIEMSGTPAGIDATYTTSTDGDGGFGWGRPGPNFPYQFKPGDVVNVTDGTTMKSLVVSPLRITSIDRHSGAMTGVTNPGATVGGFWYGMGGGQAAVGPDGGFESFWGPLPSGASGGYEQWDDDGDCTAVYWSIPYAETYVDPAADKITGADWWPGASVHVTVNLPGTPQAPDWETTVTAEDGTWSTGAIGGSIDITAGAVVTASDGDFDKSHVVTQLTVDGVDTSTDTIWGHAAAGSSVWIRVWPNDGSWAQVQRTVTADGDGHWTVDLTEPDGSPLPEGRGCDLKDTDTGTASQGDDDADFTSVEFRGLTLWAADDGYSITEDTTLTVSGDGVLGNDSYDPETVSITQVGAPSHGTLDLNTVTGTFTYRPSANYNGSDVFYYRIYDGVLPGNVASVTIDVLPVNDPPVAHGDSASCVEDGSIVQAAPGVLANDTDTDSVTLTAGLDVSTTHGTLVLNPNGSYTYTPTANWFGTDTFRYHANDGSADSGSVTVTLTVTPVNDAPLAVNDSASCAEDGRATLNVLSNDSDVEGSALSASVVSGPAHGTLQLAASGYATYTPVAAWSGSDTFTYRAYDGAKYSNTATVTITVSAVNDAPVALADAYGIAGDTTLSVGVPGVLGNDTDVEGSPLTAVLDATAAHGTLNLNGNGSFTYRPVNGYVGNDTFTYHANDGSADSEVVTVVIAIGAAPDMTPPMTIATGTFGSWRSADQTVTLTATDGGSGVASIRYALNGGPGTVVAASTAKVRVAAEGTNIVSFRAIDASGNAEATKTATVLLDKTAPPAPSLLSYAAMTPTSLTLSWPAVANNDSFSPMTGYVIRDNGAQIAAGEMSTFEVVGLTASSSHLFTISSRDAAGNISLAAQLAVTMPGGGDSGEVDTGESVTTTLVVEVPAFDDPAIVTTAPATVTIDEVTTPGTLSLVRSDEPPSDAPATFRFIDDYFDLSFSGDFTGLITVTLPYDPRLPDSRAASLTLQHWVDNAWVDVPTSVDLVNHTVTAQLDSLSPLAIVEPQSASTAATITPSAIVLYPAYGRPATFTASLWAYEGTTVVPINGFSLYLERSWGGTWTTMATGTPVAGVDGSYAMTATCVSGIRNVFHAYLGENGIYAAEEATVVVIPHAKLTTPKRSTAYPRRYRTFYVSGTIYPKRHLHGKVQVYRYSSGKWRLYATKSMSTNSYGYYKLGLKIGRSGTYKIRAYTGDDVPTASLARTYSSFTGKTYVR